MVELVWFKRDLRSVDHVPLAQAAAAGKVLPLYVVEPAYWAQPDASRRQYLAVCAALRELRARLGGLGAPLIVRSGAVVDWLARIHNAVGITRIHAHEETGNAWTFARDRAVRRFCRAQGIRLVETPQFGVIRGLRDRDSWARQAACILQAAPVPEPARLLAATTAPQGDIPSPEALGLGPDGCESPQPGDRAAGLALLESFLAGRGAAYRWAMSSPLSGAEACSRLSVPLATGALSIREVLARCAAARAGLAAMPPADRPVPLGAVDSLISRLHWHCHFIQKLESEPALEFRALHPAHEAARRPTPADDPMLLAWAEGRTGFPFLDACMRSLLATGWLNFRMRAMVQSFAHHQLNLDWRATGLVLARLFTDYEPGIHWPQVQMQSAQTGINTPRIYNPVKQGQDQDPTGAFTRRWVPELADVPLALLQTPWRASVRHTPPVVDAAEAVARARARLGAIRGQPGYRDAAQEVYRRHGSRARRIDDDNPGRRAIRTGRGQLALDL